MYCHGGARRRGRFVVPINGRTGLSVQITPELPGSPRNGQLRHAGPCLPLRTTTHACCGTGGRILTEIIDHITEELTQAVAAGVADGELVPYTDPLTVPPVLRPDQPDVRHEIEIALRPTWVRMHSQLPPTLMWGYNGTVPGPTIEVRRGQRIRVAWTNRIPLGSEYPVTAVEVGPAAPGQPQPHNRPGREGVEPSKDVAALPAWSVTHLHGAQTGGGNDGWADNAVTFGDAQLSEYPNDHQAVQWWYHDHAMDITRFNVYAGLVGTYLVRDDEEDSLGLPSGARELPLILADRNLDTDADGRLNGRLLHKTSIVMPPEALKFDHGTGHGPHHAQVNAGAPAPAGARTFTGRLRAPVRPARRARRPRSRG